MPGKPAKSKPKRRKKSAPSGLSDFDAFMAQPELRNYREQYRADATLAKAAVALLTSELERLNRPFATDRGVIFTTVEGRVKTEESFFRKLHKNWLGNSGQTGLTAEVISELYAGIKDLAGVRFSCPYYDQVHDSINRRIRPHLNELGHATDLRRDGLNDKDLLDKGDDFGYRSYHFFVRMLTPVDIFGARKPCLCEVQGRSELQHVWAVKSHDLLYKPKSEWTLSDKDIVEDMHHVSNSLRAADQFLISIRNRVRSTGSR